ncbi:MAG: hypothetical protein MZV64_11310 [Ignavibacteriales bacterium]|nr:hypothetical protein [Ignavibacteriales bacterium]
MATIPPQVADRSERRPGRAVVLATPTSRDRDRGPRTVMSRFFAAPASTTRWMVGVSRTSPSSPASGRRLAPGPAAVRGCAS